MNILNIIVLYLIMMNITGFAMMGIDKRKAIKHLWRVRESTLFLIALIGGSVGCILGMRVLHHKTKHLYFVYGMPLILILQILLSVLIIKRG